MLCSKCGHEMPDGTLFCPNCGNYNFFEFENSKSKESFSDVSNLEENSKDNNQIPKSKKQKKKKKNKRKQNMSRVDVLNEKLHIDIPTNKDEIITNEGINESQKEDSLLKDDVEISTNDTILEPVKEENQLSNESLVDKQVISPLESTLKETNQESNNSDKFMIDYYLAKAEHEKEIANKAKKGIDYRFWILFSILLLCLIFLIFYVFCSSSKKIYVELEDKLSDVIHDNFKNDTLSGQINGNLSISDTYKSQPDSWQYDVNYDISTNNRYAYFETKTNYNYNELTKVNYLINDQELYTDINKDFNHYISEILEKDKIDFNLKNNILTVNKEFEKAFRLSIRNKYISSTKNNLKNDSDENMIQNILTLDIEEYMPVLINTLLKSQDFILAYSELKGISPDELKIELQTKIDNNDFPYTIQIYTTGLFRKIIGLKFAYTNQDGYSIEIIKKGENRFEFKYNTDSRKKYTGNITINKMHDWLDIKLEASNSKNIDILANINIKNEYNKVITPKQISDSITKDSLLIDNKTIFENEINKNQSILNYDYKAILK